MKVCGIIAEYNPFHNGHLYHLEESRRRSGADYVAVVMSGSFVQRGGPAFLDKYTRTELALRGGADLVIELPALFSCGSAEDFAGAGVALLDRLGVVDTLSFGTEAENLDFLAAAAALLAEEPPELSRSLREGLREGKSYPQARAEGLRLACEARGIPWEPGQAASPNNILALEYLKALRRQSCAIRPLAVARKGEGYHSLRLDSPFCSATGLRRLMEASESFPEEKAGQAMPEWAVRLLKEKWRQTFPIEADDFSAMLAYQLLAARNREQGGWLDVPEDMERRIRKHMTEYRAFSQWAALLKTRQYTYTRTARCLCHILLGISSELGERRREGGWCGYARLLGMQKSAGPLLKAIRANSAIPVVARMARDIRLLGEEEREVLETELFASRLYALVQGRKYPEAPPLPEEYRAGLVLV